MLALLCFALAVLASPFKSKSRLEAENAALRHQLIVLRRRARGRVRLTSTDRRFLVQLYRLVPSILQVLTIIRPETLVRWHRAAFYWRWKSRSGEGRPQIESAPRALIRRMSIENPLWGAPRIHGELLKLGFAVAQSSVAKYMVKRRGPPSQGWRTFLHNHAPDIAAMDLFVVPTISFDLLYALVIIRLDRRDLVWINVTANPTAEWIARQVTEAFPWEGAAQYLIRDRDRIFGTIVTRRLLAMGIRDKPTAPASPWQNGFAERLIGSIRRECVDNFVVFSEAHLTGIKVCWRRLSVTARRSTSGVCVVKMHVDGDESYRLKQEIVLGIGGKRLLQALGFSITTFHLNEDHAAIVAAIPPSSRGTETVQWVVACDGYHSTARKLAGIELSGHDITVPWAVFDATLAGWSAPARLRRGENRQL
jgi:transposase InsO family protein